MACGQLTNDAELSTAASVACDERRAADAPFPQFGSVHNAYGKHRYLDANTVVMKITN